MGFLGRQAFVYRLATDAGDREALSLLDTHWVSEHGLCFEGILGFLDADADHDRLTPNDLRESPAFLRFLSRVIYEHVDNVDQIRMQAQLQHTGQVFLLDGRTPDAGGRVPPEDIIGAVQVERGAVVAGSFKHNPRHRLLTVNGLFRLPDEVETALDEMLRSRDQYLVWPNDGQAV